MTQQPPQLADAVSTREFHSVVDGEIRRGTARDDLVDPSTGNVWGSVTSDVSIVDDAVAAARRSQTSSAWRTLSSSARADLLERVGAGLEAHVDEIAALESLANGKPLAATTIEVRFAAHWWRYQASLLRALREERLVISPTKDVSIQHEPVGVVALITPFNGAFSLGIWKLAPALAAGNSVILKPPVNSPGSTLVLRDIVVAAGIPDDVLHIVQGGMAVGARLVEHPDVDMVSFTGSTAAAQQVGGTVSARLGRFVAEAGGKSAHIVFADASLQDAVTAVVQGAFSGTGQTCVAGSRVIVQHSIFDSFVSALRERVSRLRVGDPMAADTHLGPIASSAQLTRVRSLVDQAVTDGAVLLAGGGAPDGLPEHLAHGFWFAPTILRVDSNAAPICQTEVFGPVITVMPFDAEEDAVSIANDTPFGLAAGCWTADISRAHRMGQRLLAGTVWINTYRGMDWQTPFGGVKQSGIGRENGIEGLREFQQVKSIVQDYAPTVDPFGLVP